MGFLSVPAVGKPVPGLCGQSPLLHSAQGHPGDTSLKLRSFSPRYKGSKPSAGNPGEGDLYSIWCEGTLENPSFREKLVSRREKCEETEVGPRKMFSLTNVVFLTVPTVGKPVPGLRGQSPILDAVPLHLGEILFQLTSCLPT